MKNIQSIQNWYKLQCNGDWEHEYGIKIETLDNPGWSIKIDIFNTALQGCTIKEQFNKGDNDWFVIESNGELFSGAGDSNKLEILIDKFNLFALHNIKKSNFQYTIYKEIIPSEVRVFRPIQARMISLSQLEIISIPKIDLKELKVLDISDFDKLDFEKLDAQINYNVGDIVKCELINFYDYPSLIIS